MSVPDVMANCISWLSTVQMHCISTVYSVHPMLMSWLYCRPWIKIMSTKDTFHYIFSPLRPSGQLQRISMFKGLFFLLIVTHFICDEYHAWVLRNLSNMTDFRQSNIIYKTNNNHFCFHFSLHFRFRNFVFMKTGSLFKCRICWNAAVRHKLDRDDLSS